MSPTPQPDSGPHGSGPAFTRRFQEDLQTRLEARLRVVPDAIELAIERAHLLAELDRPREAAQIYQRAIATRAPRYPITTRAYSVLPFRGKGRPITVLLLVAPEWGNAPFRKYLDDQVFLTLQVIAEFHEPGVQLPPAQLVVNAISDAEICPLSLERAVKLLAGNGLPVINPPSRILSTSRESNARRLAGVPGVKTPRVATFPKSFFAGDHGVADLGQKSFSFPLLVRAPGFHTGRHFLRAETPGALIAALPQLPGEVVSVIEFLDARAPDGLVRKFRVMVIDGKLYPLHKAISPHWMVHYFTAEMAHSPGNRAEDQAFLNDMAAVLGPRAMRALEGIRDLLGLDYAGIDFSLGPDGGVLLFEANATMVIPTPEPGDVWNYRRAPVLRAQRAVQKMILHRASLGTVPG